MAFSSEARASKPEPWPLYLVPGLVYTGGCLITALFYAPMLWSRWVLGFAVVLTLTLATALSSGMPWSTALQAGLYFTVGGGVLALAVVDLWKRRNPSSLLLSLWLGGTFVFATWINWTVNARSILPMAPAFAILLARALEGGRTHSASTSFPWRLATPLIPAAAAALAVAHADYGLAGAYKEAARRLGSQTEGVVGSVWSQGRWGFKYYLERQGAGMVDVVYGRFDPGDVVAAPADLADRFWLEPDPLRARVLSSLEVRPPPWISTMDPSLGVGFYSAGWAKHVGPLPFVIGRVRPMRYELLEVTKRIRTSLTVDALPVLHPRERRR